MSDDDEFAFPVRRGPSWLAIVVVVILVSAGVGLALRTADKHGLLAFLDPPVSDMIVPVLTGLSVDQAAELVKARGLLLTLEAEKNDPKIPAGQIASQSPLAGSHAQAGSAVRAVVSRGAGQVVVPNLIGMRREDALVFAQQNQLVIGEQASAPSDTVEAGRVAAVEPAVGQTVTPGATIRLVLSSGRATKPVPKIVGLSLSRARKTLEEAGFKVGTTRYGYSDRYDGNYVIAQDPAENAAALPGTAINLTITEPD